MPTKGKPVTKIKASRGWISLRGSRRSRGITIVFRLRVGGRVELAVQQVAPRCRYAGTLRVRGHAGVNRIRLRGRVGKRRLQPGTYKINARGPRGRRVLSVTVVVATRTPSPAQVRAARSANVCVVEGSGSSGTGAADGSGGSGGGTAAANDVGGGKGEGSGDETRSALSPTDETRALGAHSTYLAPPSSPLQVGLLAILSMSILLLGLGSLPRTAIPHARAAALIAHRRTEIAAAGLGALIAFLIAYFTG